MTSKFWLVMGATMIVIAAGVLAAPRKLAAQGATLKTISVIAEGEASASPDYVIVKGTLPGRGDTTVAARKAFDAARAALEKDFPAGGDLAKLQFLGERFAYAPTGMEGVVMAVPGGGAAPAAEAKPSEIGEKVHFRIDFTSDMERTGVAERLATIIDRAMKSGVEFAKPASIYTVAGRGSTALTEFAIEHPEKTTTAACEAAVKQAKAKAARLAEAAGGKLGEIVSIEEIGRDKDPKDAYSSLIALSMGESEPESEFSSDSNSPVVIRRQVRVVFALESK